MDRDVLVYEMTESWTKEHTLIIWVAYDKQDSWNTVTCKLKVHHTSHTVESDCSSMGSWQWLQIPNLWDDSLDISDGHIAFDWINTKQEDLVWIWFPVYGLQSNNSKMESTASLGMCATFSIRVRELIKL